MAITRTWSRLGAWAALLLAVLFLSCGGAGGAHAPAGGLQVFNDGGLPMTELYVTSTRNAYWGPDQLAGASLLPGDAITLAPLVPDAYDIQAVFSDGSVDTLYDVQVLDGATAVVSMMNTGDGAVSVLNNSNLDLTAIYLTLSSASTWGPNQAGGPVGPGGTLTLTGITPGIYDMRVYFSDGTYVDVRGFTVSANTTLTLPVS